MANIVAGAAGFDPGPKYAFGDEIGGLILVRYGPSPSVFLIVLAGNFIVFMVLE